MMTLHLVNKSPFEKASLATCLRLVRSGAGILLLEDGVYAARRGSAWANALHAAAGRCALYVLAPDLAARGLAGDALVEGVTAVDYDGFVRLTVEYARVQSWL